MNISRVLFDFNISPGKNVPQTLVLRSIIFGHNGLKSFLAPGKAAKCVARFGGLSM